MPVFVLVSFMRVSPPGSGASAYPTERRGGVFKTASPVPFFSHSGLVPKALAKSSRVLGRGIVPSTHRLTVLWDVRRSSARSDWVRCFSSIIPASRVEKLFMKSDFLLARIYEIGYPLPMPASKSKPQVRRFSKEVNAAREFLRKQGWSYLSASRALGVDVGHFAHVLVGDRESKSLISRIMALPDRALFERTSPENMQ